MSVDRDDDVESESNRGEEQTVDSDASSGSSVETSDGPMTEEDWSTLELGRKEYLGYWVLKLREMHGGQPISRSVFWKLCCLADRHLLKETGLDIEFPRHWYKYGEVGEAHSLTRDFFNAPKARFWQGQEYHSKEIPETAFTVENDERELIRHAAAETIREYGNKDAQELREIQYSEFAPNEFIRSYSRLRKHLESLEQVEIDSETSRQRRLDDFDDSEGRNYVEQLLDRMITTFPREQYEDVYRLYLRWDDTMRMLVEQDRPIHEQKVFLEFFVEKLSEITLRFEHNHAIPEDRLSDWYDRRAEIIRELDEGIEETRNECLSRREQSGELESVAEIYDETVIEDI